MSACDFHLHTSFSDGKKSVDELLSLCGAEGLSIVSITDHDDLRAASVCHSEIRCLPGIELSSYYGDAEIHILGYGYDPNNAILRTITDTIRTERQARMERMLSRAVRLKLIPDRDYTAEIYGERVPGRALMADLLIKSGAARNREEVFVRFLGEKKVLYEPVYTLETFAALDYLLEAGCITSLAHPQRTAKDQIIKKMADRGLHALEAYYPFHDSVITQYYLKLAQKYTMMVTGGSDYHSGIYSFRCETDTMRPFLDRVYSLDVTNTRK